MSHDGEGQQRTLYLDCLLSGKKKKTEKNHVSKQRDNGANYTKVLIHQQSRETNCVCLVKEKEPSAQSESNWVVFLKSLPNLLYTVAFLLMLGKSVQLAKSNFHWSPSETLPGKVNGQKWKELMSWNPLQQYSALLRLPSTIPRQQSHKKHLAKSPCLSASDVSRLGSLCVLSTNSPGSAQEILSLPMWITRKWFVSQLVPGGDLRG